MDHTEVKKHYNKKIQQDRNYEKERWEQNDVQKANFSMAKDTVLRNIKNINYKTCLELGPGHGTWTSLLLDENNQAKYELIDISREMLSISKERFRDNDNIEYFESDFLDFNPGKTYDLFFSSRAIEYIDDKEKMVKKIADLLHEDGQGFLITKTPHYARMKLIGRKVSKFHSGQIDPSKLKQLMKKNKLDEIEMYPVTFSWPFWSSPKINQLLYKIFAQKKTCPMSRFFSESYSVKFKKI